jgi:hypothetical protein
VTIPSTLEIVFFSMVKCTPEYLNWVSSSCFQDVTSYLILSWNAHGDRLRSHLELVFIVGLVGFYSILRFVV